MPNLAVAESLKLFSREVVPKEDAMPPAVVVI
jgi:hypothetical protein